MLKRRTWTGLLSKSPLLRMFASESKKRAPISNPIYVQPKGRKPFSEKKDHNSAPKIKEEDLGPKWMKFFQGSQAIEIDFDRSLSNINEDEIDEFATRFIINNYHNFKTYQLVRSMKLMRNNKQFKKTLVEQLKKNIAVGDWELFEEDLDVATDQHFSFFYSEPLLKQLILFQIAEHFQQFPFITQTRCLAYQFRVNSVSPKCIQRLLENLMLMNNTKAPSDKQNELEPSQSDGKKVAEESSSESQLIKTFSELTFKDQLILISVLSQITLYSQLPEQKKLRQILGNLADSVMKSYSRSEDIQNLFFNYDIWSRELVEVMHFIDATIRPKFLVFMKHMFSVINKKATLNSLGDMHYITYRIPQFLKSLSPAEIEFLRPSLTFYPEIEANRKSFNKNLKVLSELQIMSRTIASHYISIIGMVAKKNASKEAIIQNMLDMKHAIYSNLRDVYPASSEQYRSWLTLKRTIFSMICGSFNFNTIKSHLQKSIQLVKYDEVNEDDLKEFSQRVFVNKSYIEKIDAEHADNSGENIVKKEDTIKANNLQKIFDKQMLADFEETIMKIDDKAGPGKSDQQKKSSESSESEEEDYFTQKQRLSQLEVELCEQFSNMNEMKDFVQPILDRNYLDLSLFSQEFVTSFSLVLALFLDDPNFFGNQDKQFLEPYFKSIHTAEFINLIGSRLDLIPSICALDLLISEKIELDKRLRQVISLSRNFADSIISGNSKDIILQRLEKHINKVDYAQEFLDDKVSHELYILDEKKLKGTKSKALNQVKLTPTNQKSQLINQKGTLNTNNFTHEVLLQFPLLIRALNPSMMREVVLLSLKTGGVKHSENYMVFPFMADFLVTSGNKKLAIFVDDQPSQVLGVLGVSRFWISRSKDFFRSSGFIVETIGVEHLQLKNRGQLITHIQNCFNNDSHKK